MVSPIVIDVIMHPYEERNIEFKTSTPWNDKSFKAKIAKSILGMANIRDGGWIVIGKVRQPDDTHEAVGMTQTDYESYSSDLLKDFVKNYAAPHVEISLEKPEYAQKKFVVIRVEEFDDVPVIPLNPPIVSKIRSTANSITKIQVYDPKADAALRIGDMNCHDGSAKSLSNC